MTIRFANKEDIPEIADLWLAMVLEEYPDNQPSKETWMRWCENLMNAEMSYISIAVVDNKIVGFVEVLKYLEPSDNKFHGVGQHLYVKPEYRKTLIAYYIWRKVYKKFREIGIDVCELFCSCEKTGFWEKKGFAPKRVLMRRQYV
jgi:GNAT superfamily N-acetyltransferase